MSKPLHPSGTHRLKLVNVLRSRFNPLEAQCIFEGTGANKGCYTLSRRISEYGSFADTSQSLIEQLEGFNHDAEISGELLRYCGREFICVIPRKGKGPQMNISRFLTMPTNINSVSHVNDPTLAGESQVLNV